MFRKFLLTMIVCCMISSVAYAEKKIVFDEGNFFTVNESFDEVLLDSFARRVMTTDEKKIYIYFDSPGGSVFALTRMIGMMKSSNIKFVCVARFAASAAFMMFQRCNERYILPDGILMSHNASGGFFGEFPRVESLFMAIKSVVTALEVETAKIMKIDYKEYKNLINNNLWITASTYKKYGAADGIINNVTCTKKLVKKEIIKHFYRMTFKGIEKKTVSFSACPLLRMPIYKENDIDNLVNGNKNPREQFIEGGK